MNKEIQKAMNRKEDSTLNKIKKWWGKNSYKVYRVVLFPIWIPCCVIDKLKTKYAHAPQWNEEKAKQILDYYIPRKAKWHEEDKSFYFFDNGYGWSYKNNKIKIKDRKFYRNYRGWYGGRIREHLINKYELEGFEKIVGCCEDGWTELTFKMK